MLSKELEEATGPIGSALKYLARIASLCLLALLVLVFASVIFRYFFNAPIFAVEDFMSVLLGLTIFMAFPLITIGGDHIKVDLLVPLFERVRWLDRLRSILIDLGIIAMTGFMAYRVWEQADRYYRRGTATQAADMELWPFVYSYVVMLVIGLLGVTFVTVLKYRAALSGKDADND
ncbi:MAG: TRAP transporter small permease [Pseudomonadota bacterium]